MPVDRLPRFSVVIPTYNQAHYLGNAIKSVLDQTFQDFEIIVVNNYSTDETMSVVNSFNDRRIKLLHYHNQGVIGAARNRGIEASCGEYVAFLDSDDLWYAKKLEKVNEVIEQQRQEVDVINHGANFKDADGLVVGILSGGCYVKPLYEHLLYRGNFICLSATVVKREVLCSVGMFSESSCFIAVEDYDLWLRLAHLGHKFYFITEQLGENLIHPGNLSNQVGRQYRNQLAVLDYHYKHDITHKTVNSRIQLGRIKASLFYLLGRHYHVNRRFGQAVAGYLRAIVSRPAHWKAYAAAFLALLRIRA